MTRRRVDLPDLLLGLFLLLVATIALVATRKLSHGTAADMGPGYMPRAISVVLAGFGLFFAGRGLLRPHVGIATVMLRPLLAIAAAVAAFALLAERAGLAVAALATILLAGLATKESRLWESLGFGIVLAGAAVLLFVQVLKLPIPVWPPGLFE